MISGFMTFVNILKAGSQCDAGACVALHNVTLRNPALPDAVRK